MTLYILSLLCCLMCFVNAPAALSQEEETEGRESSHDLARARQLLIEGTDFLHNNQNLQAKSKLEMACLAAPDLPQTHHQLGIALAKLGENEGAEKEFSTAIQLDPGMAASWLNLAAVYQSSGQAEKAKAAYQQFVDRFPQDRDVAKIRSLIGILDKEAFNQVANASDLDSSLHSNSAIPDNHAGIANIASVSDDYYADIARGGIWKWSKDHLPLAIYIEQGSSDKSVQRYSTILKNSFRDWASASEGAIEVSFVDDPSSAVIICGWSKDISKFKNSSEAANTKIYAGKSGLTKGEIEILTISGSDGRPITDNQARATCLHEVGHVLGLTGHSNNPMDVMYLSASLKDIWMNLSNRDKRTIVHLYSSEK